MSGLFRLRQSSVPFEIKKDAPMNPLGVQGKGVRVTNENENKNLTILDEQAKFAAQRESARDLKNRARR